MNICVFCSSRNDVAEQYKKTAFRLGQEIALNGKVLLYGGATGGLMDKVAEGAKSENGEIIGVISEAIIEMKRESKLPTKLIKVKNLAERKQIMRELADIFIVLPGGFGTMDEMFDILAGGLVGEHQKKLFVLNQNEFYKDLFRQIEKMKKEYFLKEGPYNPVFIESIDEICDIINSLSY